MSPDRSIPLSLPFEFRTGQTIEAAIVTVRSTRRRVTIDHLHCHRKAALDVRKGETGHPSK
jgi:hypothetical protein